MQDKNKPQLVAWRCDCGKESDIGPFVQSFVRVAVEKERREFKGLLESEIKRHCGIPQHEAEMSALVVIRSRLEAPDA